MNCLYVVHKLSIVMGLSCEYNCLLLDVNVIILAVPNKQYQYIMIMAVMIRI